MKKTYNECTLGYSILKKTDLDTIHEATLNIMEDYGIRVFGEEAHEYYSAAGCEVNRETNMVKLPRNLVNDCIESAPAEFTVYGREPGKNVLIGGKNVTYTDFGTGVDIIDPFTGEKRSTTTQDICDLARFMDAIDEISTVTIPVTAQDVHPDIKDLYEAEALFNNTSKHIDHDPEGRGNTKKVIRMAAAIVGGMDKLKEKPIISFGCCPNSPLELHKDATEQIIESAKAGIPMDVLSMGLCGGTTPVTLAGTLLVTNCEVLSGIVLSQIVSKGAPNVYGSSTTIMDLKYTTSPVGAPEHAMIGAAVAQLGQYYGIPTDVGGS